MWDDLEDEVKEELDHGKSVDELSEEFGGDPDETLQRMEDLGIDIDELNI